MKKELPMSSSSAERLTAPGAQANTFPCPLCETPLPIDATECTNCDWVKGYRHTVPLSSGNEMDWIAVALSVVPGLGHAFKGHYWTGAAYFFAMFAVVFFVGVGGAVAMGFNLFLLPLYWLWVMLHAFLTPDLNAGAPCPCGVGIKRGDLG